MQTLAGIDTTKVYHEFDFDCDQVKGLKFEQYFIHNDVVEWFEKILARMSQRLNFIKIIYNRLHHFDINHVKCVEFYYSEHDLKRGLIFPFEKFGFCKVSQYKMPWINDRIYYVRHQRERNNKISYEMRLKRIEKQLRDEKLLNCLIKRYNMEVEWSQKYNLTVFEFNSDLNIKQLQVLENIFTYDYNEKIFISNEFKFLKSTEPPSVLYSRVLTVFHHQLLSSLNIQDILSLELANKDFRLESFDSVLDRDIQVHLQKRFNLLYQHEKLETNDATEFTDVRVLKYFLYKYRECFNTVELPNHILTEHNFNLIVNQYRNLKFNDFLQRGIRFDIISPENITVCSVTVLRHKEGNIVIPDSIMTMEMRLDSDISFSLDIDEEFFALGNPPYFIEISIRASYKSVRFTDFLHKVISKIKGIRSDIIIQLRSYNNRIKSCILNSFVGKHYKFEIIFKNIIFDFRRLVDWFSKSSNLTRVSFTDCIVLLSDKHAKMYDKVVMKERHSQCNLYLTFRYMKFNIHTISLLLHVNNGEIVFDGCCFNPSSSKITPSSCIKFVTCKNMRIELEILIPLLPRSMFDFDNCQIQSNHDLILKVESFSQYNAVSFKDMDIDAEVLLKISEYICDMWLYHCRILSNEIANIPSNYTSKEGEIIYITNVEIELKVATKIFNRFDYVRFTSSRFVCPEFSIPKTSVKSNSILEFDEISITPEFIKVLKYLGPHNSMAFRYCPITNQNLLEIWAAAPQCKRIHIFNRHLVDYFFYFELVAKIYENRYDEMHQELKDGIAIPLFNLFEIKWPKLPLNDRLNDIEWCKVKIRSVYVNDWTIKLEYLENDKVLDITYERNKFLNYLDVCEVGYNYNLG